MGKGKDIAERTVRVAKNPVTGQLESTVLDDVQRAFERVIQTLDGQLLKLDGADRERLVRRVIERAQMMLPRTEGAM